MRKFIFFALLGACFASCGGENPPPAECDDASFVPVCEENTLVRCTNGSFDRLDCGASTCNAQEASCGTCGDGALDPGEDCDDANQVNDDQCRNNCQLPQCGDAILDPGEGCDDGNLINGDGCSSLCVSDLCGNGVIDTGETCDDFNTTPNDGCSAACQSEGCGDGIVQAALNETCDDANQVDNDGCDADCNPTQIVQLDASPNINCALFRSGKMRCWGVLGTTLAFPGVNIVGDDEAPNVVGDIPLPGRVVEMAVGQAYICARLDNGSVRCFGDNAFGQLGNASTTDHGPSVDDVPLGGPAIQISAGLTHTCALLATGAVQCWGQNDQGQLGYGNTQNVGDNETPASVGNVSLGTTAVQVKAGSQHTCALLTGAGVKCWGQNFLGQLGYGNTTAIGDNETPSAVGDVDVGGTVVELALGAGHTCARLDTGALRCWGRNDGRLGYGTLSAGVAIGDTEAPSTAGDIPLGGSATQIDAEGSLTCARLSTGGVRCFGINTGYSTPEMIGDNESPASVGDLPLGGGALQVVSGTAHGCALLDTHQVRCWGDGSLGVLGQGVALKNIGDNEFPFEAGVVNLGGQAIQVDGGTNHTCAVLQGGTVTCWGNGTLVPLGYGPTVKTQIGDDEDPAALGAVNVGGPVTQVEAGLSHTCALLTNGAVRCWGLSTSGQLGYGNTSKVEIPSAAGDVQLGGTAVQLAAGANHTCALLNNGALRCWGSNISGQLGYGNPAFNFLSIGDDETPASVGDVPLGGVATQVSAGSSHTCTVLDTGAVRCWGFNVFGQLGYGNTNTIGDNETPASVGDVNVGGLVAQVAAGDSQTCALLVSGTVRCWGGVGANLGYLGNFQNIGDDESPASFGDIDIGGAAVKLATGSSHHCVLLDTDNVRCWGDSSLGKAGQPLFPSNIGFNETPATAGDVSLGSPISDLGLGDTHSCVIRSGGDLLCFGPGIGGRLGYGDDITVIGDDEFPDAFGTVVLF